MKSENKIYLFFIFLSLLYWNPLSFFFIYGKTPVYSRITIHILFGVVFAVGLLLMFIIYKNKLNNKIRNIVLVAAFTGITFAVLVILDGTLGLIINQKEKPAQVQEGLIFKPNTIAHYQTAEFEYEARINSLGLRDREIEINKGNRFRILCFGDSWTFGWGVNVENSWPRKLEQYLHNNGYENTEVINCGEPGQYTRTYLKNMEKIITVLKADLVLVGVLQLDDLNQLLDNKFIVNKKKEKPFKEIEFAFVKFLKYSFENILSLFGNKNPKTIEIKSNNLSLSKSILEKLNPLQNIYFNTFDDSLRNLFLTGNLNPRLVESYIDFPNAHFIFNNPKHPATIFAIREMNKDIKKMKQICFNNNSSLIFINLPTNRMTGHKVVRTSTDFLNPYFEKHNHIDSIYRSIAEKNQVPYIELTGHFINLKDKTGYFYKYDGHPNKNGYQEIADYIGKQLIAGDYITK